MATGKTNARYIKVLLDDSGGTARDISASVDNISGTGLRFDQTDVTAYSDGVHNFTLGHPEAEIDLSGPFNNVATTGAHTILATIIDAPYSQDTYTLTVQIGIRAAAAGGDPEFEGEYLVTDYTVNGDGTWSAHLVPGSATVPAWGTV